MAVIKTPLQEDVVELSDSGKYWKLVLPLDYKLNYNGRELHFDKKYLENVKTAFDENATEEQVAFQLANDDNAHDTKADKEAGRNYDPERFRGEIDALQIREDRADGRNGLWARLAPTEAGTKLINDNRKLGVSASLRESYPAKGKVYPVVLRHLLGTIDPKVRGMGEWEKAEVSLSNDDDKNEEVIDLATTTETKPEGTETKPEDGTDQKETVTVPKEDWDNVLAFVSAKKQEDADAEAAVAAMAGNDGSDLSNENKPDPKYIQLANEVAEQKFERKADEWRRAGVPNPIIELARPILASGESMDIELSNGSKPDVRAVISSILDESKGYIDLSAQETTQRSQEEEDEEAKAVKALNDYLSGF